MAGCLVTLALPPEYVQIKTYGIPLFSPGRQVGRVRVRSPPPSARNTPGHLLRLAMLEQCLCSPPTHPLVLSPRCHRLPLLSVPASPLRPRTRATDGKIPLTLPERWWALQHVVTSIRGLARAQRHLPLGAKALHLLRLPLPLEWYARLFWTLFVTGWVPIGRHLS